MSVKRGKFEVVIEYSNYSTDSVDGSFKDGDQFISLSITGYQEG